MARTNELKKIIKNNILHLLPIEEFWENLLCHLSQLAVGLLIIRLLNLSDFTIWVDDEYLIDWYPNINITQSIRLTISKAAVKRRLVRREQPHDVFEAGNLEHLRLS